MGIFVGTPDEYKAKLFAPMSGRSPGTLDRFQKGGQADIYGGIINPNGGLANPAIAGLGAPAPATPALPRTRPATPDSSPALAAIDAATGAKPTPDAMSSYVAPAPPTIRPMSPAPNLRAIEIGGYLYPLGADGKVSGPHISRAEVHDENTILGGAIGNAIRGMGMEYNPSPKDSLNAQGVSLVAPKPPVNRTGMTPDGTTWEDGVKTGVDPRFAGMTTQQRQDYATQEGQARAMMATGIDPATMAARSRLETGAQGDISTGFTSGTQRGEGAANIAQKVKTGQISLANAMKQGYKPPAAPNLAQSLFA